jgi:hypothetical protein
MWAPSQIPETVLQRIDARGTATTAPLQLPACARRPSLGGATTAGDGSVWLADVGCDRLIRIAPDGALATVAIDPGAQLTVLTGDRAGGAWFATANDQPGLGHADAAGTLRRSALPEGRHVSDIALAPDGAAHLAFGTCELGRADPGGPVRLSPAPVNATKLAFDPAGGLWLASTSRLVHAPAPPLSRGACDDTPPRIRLSPALRDSVPLERLRRGIRITVREPAVIYVSGDYGEDDHDTRIKIVRAKRGGTLVFRLPKASLRRLARIRDPFISLTVEVYDREGNLAAAEPDGIRVTR